MTHFLPPCLHCGILLEHVCPIKLRTAPFRGGVPSEVRAAHRGMAGCAFPPIINISPPPRYCHQFNISTGVQFHPLKPLPYAVPTPQPHSCGQHRADFIKYSFERNPRARRARDRQTHARKTIRDEEAKRGFSRSSEEVARNVHFLRIGNTKLISIRLVKYDS